MSVKEFPLALINKVPTHFSGFDQFSMVVALVIPSPFIGASPNVAEKGQLNSALSGV